MMEYDKQNRALRTLVWIITITALVVAIASFVWKGTLTFSVPPESTVWINGHEVSGKSVSLRPGYNSVIITSARYTTYIRDVKVKPFVTTTVTAEQKPRDPGRIVASTVGAYGMYGIPEADDVTWSSDNTWLSAALGPGSPSTIVLHYVKDKWTVAYYNSGSYPHTIADLPENIQQQVRNLEASYVQ